MTLTQMMDADIQAVEPDMSVQFSWNGVTYTGQKTQTPDSLEMADAGWIPKYSTELLVRNALFVAGLTPAKEDNFIIAGITYRVDKITPDQAGVATIYSLLQEN